MLDVLLLACAFETFCETSIAGDGLDPKHFLTAPSLTDAACYWNCFRRELPVRIQNMSDIDQYNMVERGLRGGVCQVMHSMLKANLPIMGADYDSSKAFTHLIYIDANNLYGKAMSFPSHKEYRMERIWENGQCLDLNAVDARDEISDQGLEKRDNHWNEVNLDLLLAFILTLDEEGRRGYFLEVDIDYPPELHDLHNDYPLIAENKATNPSPYTRETMQRMGIKIPERLESRTVKLVMDFEKKRHYSAIIEIYYSTCVTVCD